MRIPLGNVAFGVATLDEARFVVGMPIGLAAAVARNELQHLGMLAGELIHRTDDVDWAAWHEPRVWDWRRA